VRELAKLDRRDRALEIARDGVRHAPRSAVAHVILGIALESYGSTREALAELRLAELLDPRPASVGRVRQLIASMRAGAADSLREMFAADSVAHPAARPATGGSR